MFNIKYPWKYEWKHRNLAFIFLSTAIAVYMLTTPEIAGLIGHSGKLGYLGALVAGFFFSSLFTTPISMAVLAILGKSLDPLWIAAIGAFGAMTADYIIFQFVRRSIDNLKEEILELKFFIERHNPVHTNPNPALVHKLKMYLTPVLAGLIIASPLPDEIAIGMLGAAHYEKKKVLVFAFVANFLGILAIAHIGRYLL
ncbi:MAG: hypothetical protein HY516_02405 [Candidatus Aenigmarchaeota archaeon]|nr:hypothetical protein [Candidatus Aenigmarchaeota archaeon]